MGRLPSCLPLDVTDQQTEKPAIVLLMGPTAAGKTRLAIALAKTLQGEIISVDSALVYRGMDIGTAKPSLEERNGIPHHLIDILDPREAYSTGQFRLDAEQLIQNISQRHRLPILVGGTMLYFNGLTQGLARLPPRDPSVREAIEAQAQRQGWASVHRMLGQVDPASAARIHVNDPQRIQRALEVYRLTGRPLSQLIEAEARAPLPYRLIKIRVAPRQRTDLHEAIHQRFLNMLDQGFMDEVSALRARGDLSLQLASMRAVGYRQAWQYLDGEFDYEALIEKGVSATRQLAKRQLTWLRKETDALEVDAAGPDALEQVLAYVRLQCGAVNP